LSRLAFRNERRLQASREFGNITLATEASGEVWGWIWLERLAQDVRHSARLVARNPGFTAVAVLTLALGIGANAAIFGLLDKIVLRMLPVRDPEELRLVEVARSGKRGAPGKADTSYTYTQYVLWRDHNRSFTALAGANSGMRWRDQSAASDKSWHLGEFVSGNYFEVLGVSAAIGRILAPADDSIENAGGPAGPVAVLSDLYWRVAFDANPTVIGRQINVNGAWVTVVGVTPPGFFGMQIGSEPEIFCSDPFAARNHSGPGQLVARSSQGVDYLGEGVRTAETRAFRNSSHGRLDFNLRGIPGLAHERHGPRGILCQGKASARDSYPRTGRPRFLGAARPLLGSIEGLDGDGRHRFVNCVRQSRQPFVGARQRTRQGNRDPAGDWGVAWADRTPVPNGERDAGPGRRRPWASVRILEWPCFAGYAAAGPGPDRTGRDAGWADSGFCIRRVAGERASIRTNACAVRNAPRNWRCDETDWRDGVGLPQASPGKLFIRQNVLQVRIDVDRARTPKSQWQTVYQQVVDRAVAVPGVRAASLVNHGLIAADGATSSGPMHFPGYRFQEGESRNLLETYVGADYFPAAGIPLRSGRLFGARDGATGREVAIINEALARQYFGGRNPVGLRFGMGDNPDNIEIIGVVADAKYFNLRQDPVPMAYYPFQQVMPARMNSLIVGAQGDATTVAASLRDVIIGVRPDLLQDVRTLSSQIDDSLFTERMLARISGFFGVLALALTCIGLYGIVAQSVVRRIREIGIRIALGAAGSDVVRMVLRETLTVSVVGLAIGTPLAAGLTRLIGAFCTALSRTIPLCSVAPCSHCLRVAPWLLIFRQDAQPRWMV
jgi:hypothetical protein